MTRYDVYATPMASATLPGPRTEAETRSWILIASRMTRERAERYAAAAVERSGWKGARVFEAKSPGAMVYEIGAEADTPAGPDGDPGSACGAGCGWCGRCT